MCSLRSPSCCDRLSSSPCSAMHHKHPLGGVLSPMLFNIYIDDLIVTLCNSGYGAYIGNVFSGCIVYADDIALISVNCRGLSKMLRDL